MSVVCAGVSCGRGSEHATRTWVVGSDRRVTWRERDHVRVLELPVPGTVSVLAFDAHSEAVVLENGETWRLAADANGGVLVWRPCAAASKEDDVKLRNSPALQAGGNGCGCVWVMTPDRRLWVWTTAGRAPLADAPVPGAARVLAVDVAHRAVVLDDGSRFEWLGGRWTRLPGLHDTASTIPVRCLSGVALGPALGDFGEGEVRDLPEDVARRLIADGRAEPVS